MANIDFFDNSAETPKVREDVRLNKIGLYVYPDGRRIAVGFDMTPFLEPPSVQVTALNQLGMQAGSLTVIQANEANFYLVMHLRDAEPTNPYHISVELFYRTEDGDRQVVHTLSSVIDTTETDKEHIIS